MPGDPLYAKDPALLRRINATSILRVLYEGEPSTLSQLVGCTGLSRRTVEAAVEELVRDGLVVECSPDRQYRSVGRPARSYAFRPDAGYVLAIEVRRRRIVCRLADLVGSAVAEASEPVDRAAGRADRVAAIAGVTRTVLRRGAVSRKQLRAVTIGTPGVVRDGAVVTHCNVLPEWSEFSLRGALARSFRCPIEVENDVNLAATGERWHGVCVGVDTMVWVLVGRRARVAVVIDGKLYRGADGAAGEIGWLPALGWSDVRDHALSFAGFERTPRSESAERTLTAAAAGDAEAVASVDALARALSRGLAAVVLALDPACLVIGGGPARAGDVLAAAIRRHLGPLCLKLPEVRTSTLGDDAVLVGGVRRSLDEVESTLFAVGP